MCILQSQYRIVQQQKHVMVLSYWNECESVHMPNSWILHMPQENIGISVWYQRAFHRVPNVRFSLNLQHSWRVTRWVICEILKKFLCAQAEITYETSQKATFGIFPCVLSCILTTARISSPKISVREIPTKIFSESF